MVSFIKKSLENRKIIENISVRGAFIFQYKENKYIE